MSDFLLNLANNPATRGLVKTIGLPSPTRLARGEGAYEAQPLSGKTALLGSAAGGYAGVELAKAIKIAGAEVLATAPAEEGAKVHALVFDATGARNAVDLKSLYNFFHPLMGRIATNGRVLVATAFPEQADDPAASAAARAVEGFVRSVAKEIGKRGATANTLYVEKGAESRIEGVVRFILSAHSAYVDGQPFRVSKLTSAPGQVAFTAPLKGKVALVTGGARGIGAATAKRLAEEGAHVVCADIPADQATLDETVKSIGGTALAVDVTDAKAPRLIADFLKEKFGGVDIVIHNAGVTRDKTLARMDERHWDMVLGINLDAILRIDQVIVGEGVLRNEGRVVCLSSIGGIAGNLGQTNYGATKAGLIGYVKSQGPRLASKGICVNAVAPGFIETRMTAAIPFMIREFGRRLNSMSQGGQPIDVAELITFLSTPGAYGVNGETIRVCGQSLVGA